MEPMRMPAGRGTAIPARFVWERERVLRILSRWEESVTALVLPGGQEGLRPGTAGSR
jgi:hypothetical protein